MAGEIIGSRGTDIPVFAGSEVLTFAVSQMPPGIRIWIYVNGVNITPFCAPISPANARIGDPITTDEIGQAIGYIYIPATSNKYKFPVGEIQLTFTDSGEGIAASRYTSEAILFNHGLSIVDTEQGNTISLRRTEKIRTSTQGSSSDETENRSRLDPLAQTFFVDEVSHPLGVVVTGLLLFFNKRDDSIPVAVELRPMVNGKPSTTEYMSGSYSAVAAQNVQLPDTTTGNAKPTGFSFQHPIYLKPGEYAFCVMTKSNKYELFSAQLGNGKTVKQPYAGTLFKPQNTGEWLSASNEDLTFALVKAKFNTNQSAIFEMGTPKLPALEYNKLRLLSTEVSFGTTAYASYRVQTTAAGSRVKSDYVSVLPYGEPNIQGRQEARELGDLKLEVTLTTKSEDVAPILDRQLMAAQGFRYTVKPYSQAISDSELTPNKGLASGRYVSKIVPLQEGYDSTGIQVSLDVNRKLGTDIEVYARVLSRNDKFTSNGIDGQSWFKIPLVEPAVKTYAGLDDDLFFTETYKLLDPFMRYTRDNTNVATNIVETITYENFAYYQVKVVFYASSPSIVPKIKNLVATSIL